MKVRYLILTLLMLGLYVWAATRQREVAALPSDLDLRNLHFPVRVESGASLPIQDVQSVEELELVVQRYPVDSIVRLTDSRNGRTATFLVPVASTFYLTVSWINALFFWFVSLVVFAPRIHRVPARDLYWACILYGLAVTVGDVHFPKLGAPTDFALPALRVLAVTIIPILLLHLSLSFPVRRRILDRLPRLVPAVTTLGLVTAGWYIAMLSRYFIAPDGSGFEALKAPRVAFTLFLAVVFSAGCLWFLQTSRMATNEKQRDQTKWILWGIAFGATPFVLLYKLPSAWGAALIPVEVARLFSIVMPAAFTFAVVRYKFLDIDVIIRRSVVYVSLAMIMAAVYFVLGVWIGNHAEARFPSTARYIPMVAAIVPVLLFRPTHRFLGRWLDRTFFKIRFDHERALSEFVERINTASSQAQLAHSLNLLLSTNLGTRVSGVIVSHGDYLESAGAIDSELLQKSLETFGPRFKQNWRSIAAPQASSLPELVDENFPALYLQRGIRLAHPLGDGKTLSGVVLLGEKITDRRYVEDEIRFLHSAAEETSKCLEYVELIQRIQHESVARRQLAEMNQFKTDFFSQVAHDLRSPLTSISWSTRNLLDGVTGDLDPKQREYIEGMAASAEQLVRLVNNLLEIARMEQHEAKLDLQPFQLEQLLREVTDKLASLAGAKGVRFDLEVDSGIEPVSANRSKLVEVVDNLLANAVRYSPPGQIVEITLARAGAGRQCLTVRDHGPGISEQDPERVFEAYHQGEPSPYSTQQGFGLGLHVVKTYVELMGGSVEARNHSEGGALFTCSFDDWSNHGSEE